MFMIVSVLFVKGIVIIILMIMVAGTHIGAVRRSAIPPPIAAAAKAYGVGKSVVAR